MDTKRLILFIIFSFSILMLWDAWQRQHAPVATVSEAQRAEDSSIPQTAKDAAVSTKAEMPQESGFKLQNGQRVSVETDLFKADIDTIGGDLRRLELTKHRAASALDENFVLLDDRAAPMLYVAQTGLIGADLPTHKTAFTSAANIFKLQDGAD